jgi:hypothetical protein
MTTITVEIDKDQDLSAVKDFVAELGLKYQIEENETLLYTKEIKDELDKRYDDYQKGKVELVSSEESQSKIQALLSSKS